MASLPAGAFPSAPRLLPGLDRSPDLRESAVTEGKGRGGNKHSGAWKLSLPSAAGSLLAAPVSSGAGTGGFPALFILTPYDYFVFLVDPKVHPAPGVNLPFAKARAARFYTAGLFTNPLVIAFPRHLLGCV